MLLLLVGCVGASSIANQVGLGDSFRLCGRTWIGIGRCEIDSRQGLGIYRRYPCKMGNFVEVISQFNLDRLKIDDRAIEQSTNVGARVVANLLTAFQGERGRRIKGV